MRYLDDLPGSAQLVVVGGGIVGAATAFYAARAGFRPLLLEARPALCTLTTPVATGAFRLQFDNREETELVGESVDLFLRFSERTGLEDWDLRIRRQGYLWCATGEEAAARQGELVERQRSWGLDDVELLDGEEVRRRFPYVAPSVRRARFRAGDGFLDTKRLTLGLAEASGADIVLDSAATGFRIARGRLTAVETERGTVATERAVIAAGPLAGPVAALAGISLPIETVRRQKVVLPEVPEVPADAPMTIDEETGVHWRPWLAGAALLHTDPATPPSEPTFDVSIDRSFGFRLLDPRSPISVGRIAPFWREVWRRGTAHWWVEAGQYSMTPDHRPLIGPTEVEGLHVNGGYSGHGIMGGPAGSRILVDILSGTMTPEENPFRLDRTFELAGRPTL